MLETYLRKPFQRLFVDKVADKMSWASPNAITLISALLGGFGAGFLIYGHLGVGLFCFLLSGYGDVLDGSIARIKGSSALIGAVLDLSLDRFVEFMMVLSLYFLGLDRGLACLSMLGSMYLCTASFFAVSMCTKGGGQKSFYYSPGLIERAETFVFFFAMVLFEALFLELAYLYASLVLLTTCVRLVEFIRSQKAFAFSGGAKQDLHK